MDIDDPDYCTDGSYLDEICCDDDDDEEYSDGGYSDDEKKSPANQEYTILNEEDIRNRQEEDINKVSSALSVSRDSASILLRNYDWSVEKVHEAWFDDEGGVRKRLGLMDRPIITYKSRRETECKICFDMVQRRRMYAAPCGHQFCKSCWKNYVRVAITDGPSCLTLRCPEPECAVAVDQEMVNTLARDEDKQKYSRFLLRSYIEANKNAKWCPAPGCENALEFLLGDGNYDVICKCKHPFCWNCSEDAHRPVSCDIVAKWIFKNSSESENTEWLIANTKPCPKCRKPIEKNQGCMHMTCTAPCRFQFCWLCLGSWSKHGTGTGGFYACNTYAKEIAEGKFDKDERARKMAKMSIEKYTHYYERWAGNQKSRVKAAEDLQKLLDRDIERLSNIQATTITQLRCLTDAWLQIIECRRVLKWTYAYGYYLPENEPAKKKLFEYLQGQAEDCLERLHDCVEKELKVFIDANRPSDNFIEFSNKLIGLTNVTRNYFENLVQGLENGLTELQVA